MNCEQAREFVWLYQEGSVDEGAKMEFIAHVKGCESCATMEKSIANLSVRLREDIKYLHQEEIVLEKTMLSINSGVAPGVSSRVTKRHVIRWLTIAAAAVVLVAVGLNLWLSERQFDYAFPDNAGFVRGDPGSIVRHIGDDIFRLEKGKLQVKISLNSKHAETVTVHAGNVDVRLSEIDKDGMAEFNIRLEVGDGATFLHVSSGVLEVTGEAVPFSSFKARTGDLVHFSKARRGQIEKGVKDLGDERLHRAAFRLLIELEADRELEQAKVGDESRPHVEMVIKAINMVRTFELKTALSVNPEFIESMVEGKKDEWVGIISRALSRDPALLGSKQKMVLAAEALTAKSTVERLDLQRHGTVPAIEEEVWFYTAAVKNKDPEVRHMAAWVLWRIVGRLKGKDLDDVIAVLVEDPIDNDLRLRVVTTFSMSLIISQLQEGRLDKVVNALSKRLEDPDVGVGVHAANALAKVASRLGKGICGEMIDTCVRGLEHTNQAIRQAVGQILSNEQVVRFAEAKQLKEMLSALQTAVEKEKDAKALELLKIAYERLKARQTE